MITLRPGSAVYAIGSPGNTTLVKIGKAQSLAARLRDIQAMCPVPLEVLWYTSGGFALESKLHRIFRERRMHGEWFDFAGEDVATLLDQAAGVPRDAGSPRVLHAVTSAIALAREGKPEYDSRTLRDVWRFGDAFYNLCDELAWSLVDHTRSLHRFSSWDELLWSDVESAAMKLRDAVAKTHPRYYEGRADA